MAASTSRAAASILRVRSNCRVITAAPSVLVEVISLTPAIRPNCRSSGVAMEDATFSGLAPGSEADTETVGKSTVGKGATGSRVNAAAPASPTPMVSRLVATGRLMNGSERFISVSGPRPSGSGACVLSSLPLLRPRLAVEEPPQPRGGFIEEQIDHRGRIQRQRLAEQQSADDGDA